MDYQANNSELEKSLFGEIDSKPIDIKKWIFAVFFPTFNESFGKYTSVTREKRDNYFLNNASYPSVLALCNLFVPFNVYMYDISGRKAKIPLEILDDEFIVDESNESEFSTALIYWPQINHLRDKFYLLSKSISRLDLSEEEARHIFFNFLCKLLDVRIIIYRKFQHTCNIPKIEVDAEDTDVSFLRIFIDFDSLNESEIQEIYEQSYFFQNCLTMPIWMELFSALGESIESTRIGIIESTTSELINSSDDKRKYIAKILFRIDSAINIYIFNKRTCDLEFLKLERTLLQKAKETIAEIKQIDKSKSKKVKKKKISFKGPIGQVFIDSNVHNSSFEAKLTSNDLSLLSSIRSDLEEFLQASKEKEDIYEIFSQTIKEVANFESTSIKGDQVKFAKKAASWFQRLKDLKDTVAISFLPVDIAQKLPILINKGEAFFNQFVN